jgi:predicted DNA-binding WGR domain protein
MTVEQVQIFCRVQFEFFDETKWYEICIDLDEQIWFAWGKRGENGRYQVSYMERSRDIFQRKIKKLIKDGYTICKINHESCVQKHDSVDALIQRSITELLKEKPTIHRSDVSRIDQVEFKPGILCPIW